MKDVDTRVNLIHALAGCEQRLRDQAVQFEDLFVHLANVLENMSDGFIMLDESWCYNYVNASAEQILNKSREELLNQCMWDVFPSAENPRYYAEFHRAVAENRMIEFEEHISALQRWFSVRVYPAKRGVAAHFRDVTHYKETEARVMAAQQLCEFERTRLRAVLDLLPVGVFIADSRGRILEINRAAHEIWGEAAPHVSNIGGYENYQGWRTDTGEPLASEEWALARALRGETVITEEVIIQTFDGKRKVILNSAVPVYDEQGKIANAISVNVDLTERKAWEETREELSRLKDLFIDTATHEIRTPLTMVRGYIELLKHDLDGAEIIIKAPRKTRFIDDIASIIDIIDEQTQRVDRLITDMMEASRMQRQQFDLQLAEEVDLTRLVREVVDQYSQINTNYRFEVATQSANVISKVDRDRIQQVISNLINNAMKYSAENTLITVGIERHGREVRICVQDRGPGISKEHQERLFERFYRIRNKENRSVKGLGLGLYISHQIVQSHGGRMWVESQLGQGTTFYFALPLK